MKFYFNKNIKLYKKDDINIMNNEKAKIEDIKNICDLLKWRLAPKGEYNFDSVENSKSNECELLGWNNKDSAYANNDIDVLYSVLSIYVLGLAAYYPDKYKITNSCIMAKKKSGKNQNAYSGKHVKEVYKNSRELNENKNLNEFAIQYFSVGNVYPLWPGGNTKKGLDYVFDLPELFFNKHYEWFKVIDKAVDNTCLENLSLNGIKVMLGKTKYHVISFKSTKAFLESLLKYEDKEARIIMYNAFLEYINNIIKGRNIRIKNYINNQKNATFS